MKRRIFMLLVAMVMVLGLAQVAFASAQNYSGSVSVCVMGEEEETEYFTTTAIYSDNTMSGEFTTSSGHNFKWSVVDVTPGSTYVAGNLQVIIDDQYTGDYGYYIMREDGSFHVSNKYTTTPFEYDFGIELLPDDSTLYEVSTGFTGTAVSDRGDYNLYLAGYFCKDLTDGTHVLSLSDITSQTIAIVAHNNANGINRNMNQSTIEEMTVTVSGGVATEMIIRGRVQTDGGALDRYTATINP